MSKRLKHLTRIITLSLTALVFAMCLSGFSVQTIARADTTVVEAKLSYERVIVDVYPDYESHPIGKRLEYTVVGIEKSWAEQISSDDKQKLAVKIPATYQAADDFEPIEVTSVSENAFRMSFNEGDGFITDYKITELDLSEAINLKSIGDFAFFATDITTVDFSNTAAGVDTWGFAIGISAFEGCKNLTSLNLNCKAELIDVNVRAFANCTALKVVDLSCKKTSPYEVIAYDEAFGGCTSLNTIYLVDSIVNYGVFLDESIQPENVILCGVKSLLEFTASAKKISEIHDGAYAFLANKFTYQIEIEFVDSSGNKTAQNKLYDRPFNYENLTNGDWAVNENYAFPKAGKQNNLKWVNTNGKVLAPTDRITSFTFTTRAVGLSLWQTVAVVFGSAAAAALIAVLACFLVKRYHKEKHKRARLVAEHADFSVKLVEKEKENAELKANVKITELTNELKALLTAREQDVALLILQNKHRSQITKILCISEGTAKTHISNILQKTYCKNTIEFKDKFAG